MYKVEKKPYGYKLLFDGFIAADEMEKWVEESKNQLTSASKEFGIFVDMRGLKPLPADAQTIMQGGQKLYKQKGMLRSVVIVSNAITKMQFQRIGKETGIYNWERYIDSSATPNWETVGVDWVSKGIDPDL
ncbi:MAG: hypothetical protein KAI81_08115 [Candidatus Marinimicrobia bacterium]|nr:hypothetical protein [Candidatus Neomarinimicrobiota bacterium]